MQSWFHSPYWIDGFSLQQVYEQCFKLDPGIGGVLRFPWIATFHTHRFVEGYDGCLGFWVLALLPCCFIPLWLRRTHTSPKRERARTASQSALPAVHGKWGLSPSSRIGTWRWRARP